MKKLIFLSLLVCVAFATRADVITADQAQSIAGQWFAPSTAKGTSRAPINITYNRSIDDNLHIFNRGENQGFVIVSGWDGTEQTVLAYSDEGSFDYANAPDNVRWFLNLYSQYIDTLKTIGIKRRCVTSVAERKPQIVVEPLLKTKWEQGWPYNEKCPQIDGQPCKTGCVATAFAQLMNFYQWPPEGMGEHTNTWSTGEHRDFRHTYDWNNLDVAELMADIGTAMNSQYGVLETPTYIEPYAFTTYFGYAHVPNDPTIDRSNYKPSDEYREELLAGRPKLYSGKLRGVVDDPRGHAVIVDGMTDNNLFHINFGWGGAFDGYYSFCLFDDYIYSSYYIPPYGGLTHLGPSPNKRFEQDGAIYEVTGDKEVKVLSFPETPGMEIVVGGTVEYDNVAYDIVSCKEALQGRGVADLRVKGNIKHIDNELFMGSKALRNVVLEEGVESIGRYAFSLCNFESFTYPESLKHVEEGAFMGSELKSFTLKKGLSQVDYLAFYSASIDNLEIADGVVQIPDSTFCHTTISNLSIPASVRTIGRSAFANVFGLESLALPDAVTLADSAFCGSNITISNVENAKSIGRYALEGNILPATIEFKQIEKLDFFGLGTKPEKIILPATLVELGARNAKFYLIDEANKYFHSEHGIAYNKDKTRLIDYPTGAVHDYWPDARMHYYIYIPEGVKEIGDYAINDDEKVVYLPSTIEYVGNYGLPHWNASINCYAKKAPYFANYMPGEND